MSREFPLVLCWCCFVFNVKNVWNDFGKFLFVWSYTNCELLRVGMSFNLTFFLFFVQRGTGFPWAFKVNYSKCFLLNYFSVIHDLGLGLPHDWQPYWRWDSKITEYIVFKSFESTCYLILAKSPIALLRLSFIVCMCCLNFSVTDFQQDLIQHVDTGLIIY